MATIKLHSFDLPETFHPSASVAIDTEAMGLCYHRDRLCLVQLTNGDDDTVHLVHFPTRDFSKSPRLLALLTNDRVQKIFHYARFDVALLQHSFNIQINNIFCTKIASRLCRTYTNRHSLKDLCKDLLGVDLLKEEQTSDWGQAILTDQQKNYAARDVLYLHALYATLVTLLQREKRTDLAQKCFDFLSTRAALDCLSGEEFDIFSHSC